MAAGGPRSLKPNLYASRRRRLGVLTLLLTAVILYFARQLGYQSYPLHYRDAVVQRASQYGLDPFLLAAVIQVESRWNPAATSPRGARGLLQVMPGTGEWAARQLGIPDFSADLLYSPEYSAWVGSWYLSYLLRDFGGDEVLALAAYNGGQAHVRQWLADAEWTGERATLEQIPFAETREFIRRVQVARVRYRLLYRPDGTPRF